MNTPIIHKMTSGHDIEHNQKEKSDMMDDTALVFLLILIFELSHPLFLLDLVKLILPKQC